MRRGLKLYLEASYWDGLGDPAHPKARSVSYRFFQAILDRHEIWISPLVLAEVDATPEPAERRVIRRRIRRAHPELVSGRGRAESIANELREEWAFSTSVLADLTHVGYSILAGADALVTWDKKGLARAKTRRAVQEYCSRRGKKAPLIGEPEDVAKWLSIEM